MTRKKHDSSLIQEFILKAMTNHDLKNIDELAQIVKSKFDISELESLELILNLEKQGKIRFSQITTSSLNFKRYVLSSDSYWYWAGIVSSLITVLLVLFVPENNFFGLVPRSIFGLFFLLFFPGYSFLKLFLLDKEISVMTQIVFSLGMSLVIVPVVGFFMASLQFGLEIVPMLYFFVAINFITSTLGLLRGYQIKMKNSVVHA